MKRMNRVEKKMGLTNKEKQFILEYLIDFNATQAAIRAGYSPKTARVKGSQKLTKVNIQQAIQQAIEKRETKADMKIEDLQQYWKSVMFTKVTDVVSFNESGVSFVKNSDEIPEATVLALQSIEVVESFGANDRSILRTKVKMKDGLKASELYARSIGAFNEKEEEKDKGEVTIVFNVVQNARD